jgi:HEAT repeats
MDWTRNGFAAGFLAIVSYGSCASLEGQTVERDTTITGPRGRTIERQVEIQRKPGSIERDIQVTRPGGTISRQTQIQRSPVMGPVRRGPLIAGPWPRPVWAPRPVVIGPAAPAFGFGLLAVPALSFSFGGGGGGGMMGGPGGAGTVPPGAMGPGGPGAGPPPPDEVALMTQRMQSFFWSNRKEAAYTLGRLGDPRAVPSLIHTLKYDSSKDVRIASAIALGEIGGPDAAIGLERASIYDHRDDVKKAAATALNRLNAKANAAPPLTAQGNRPGIRPMVPPPDGSSPFRESRQPNSSSPAPEPAPTDTAPWQGQSEPATPQPPPPPTPVTAPAGGPQSHF